MLNTLISIIAILVSIGLSAPPVSAQCSFARPKQAKKLQLALVPAHAPCGTCTGGIADGVPCSDLPGCSGVHCRSSDFPPCLDGLCAGDLTIACSNDGQCGGSAPCNLSTCDGPETSEQGLEACVPETENEAQGPPAEGWVWGPKSKGSIQIKASVTKDLNTTLNPPADTSDFTFQLKMSDIRDGNGDLVGADALDIGAVRVTIRATFDDRENGDRTIQELQLVEAFKVSKGRASLKTSLNAMINPIAPLLDGLPACSSVVITSIRIFDDAPISGARLFAEVGLHANTNKVAHPLF